MQFIFIFRITLFPLPKKHFCLLFANAYPFPLHVAKGFELGSSGLFVGAHLSTSPVMMSWNYARRVFTQHAKAVCTHWHGWIPPWWWFATLTAVLAVALEGSTLCLTRREVISRLATRRSLDWTAAVWVRKMERLQTLNLKSSVEWCSHRCMHRHMDVRNVFTGMRHCTYKRRTNVDVEALYQRRSDVEIIS